MRSTVPLAALACHGRILLAECQQRSSEMAMRSPPCRQAGTATQSLGEDLMQGCIQFKHSSWLKSHGGFCHGTYVQEG